MGVREDWNNCLKTTSESKRDISSPVVREPDMRDTTYVVTSDKWDV